MKDMAKNKNKKSSLFRSGKNGGQNDAARVPEDSIDLTNRGGEKSDSDLDINELLRKYMPAYQDDGENSDDLVPPEIPEGAVDMPADDPFSDLIGDAAQSEGQDDGGELLSAFMDRLTDRTAMTAEEIGAEDGASEEPKSGGLFSRILKTTEEAEADEPASAPAGGVFSRIRQTVEEEESRRAEQIKSDEELLSALDSAFANPAEESPEGGDFQVPVSEKPSPFHADDLIREYEFDLNEGVADPADGHEDAKFTASDTVTGAADENSAFDFADDAARAEAEVFAQNAGKPVGEEMSDEQVMGLFSEVKPQKKKFSLFRRNKKPKAVTADDEFIPDDDLTFGSGAAQNQQNDDTPADVGEMPAEPVYDNAVPDYPADSAIPDDDTDALIAEATAAVFGRGRQKDAENEAPAAEALPENEAQSDAQTGGAAWEDMQYAEEFGADLPAENGADGTGVGDSVEDAVEAMWRQAAEAASLDIPAEEPAAAEAPVPAITETAPDGDDAALADEKAGAWARFAEKARQTADDTPIAAEEIDNGENDKIWEDAAEALQSAAMDHAVEVKGEMGTEPAAPVEKPKPAKPANPPFVRQSRRSAANLTDEELLQWAAETLAEDRMTSDFDRTPETTQEEPAFGKAKNAIADVGEEIPDVSAFDAEGGSDLPAVTADSSLHDLENYLGTAVPAGESGEDADAAPTQSVPVQSGDKSGDTGTWQTPDEPYTDEEFDPTDINLMVAFDLDDGHEGKSGKAKALGDKLAARQQNRDTTVRLDRPEFVDRTQIPAIRKEYRNRSLSLFIRLILCVIFGVLLFLYENIEPVTKLLTGTGMQFGGVLDPRVYPTVYAMVSLQLMLLCCLSAYEEIISGVKSIFIGCPKPEAMTPLLAVAGILYSAVISRVTQSPDEPVMFNSIVGLACFMTLMSAVYQNKREMMNFRIVSSKKTKHIVRRLKDDESELEARAFAEADDACDVMKIEKTDFIDGFFARLQKPDQTTGTFMMFVMGATVLLAVIVGIIDRVRGGTSANVARVIYESLLMLAPLSVFISFSYPFYRANLTAKDYDSAIIGETSLDEYSNASIISFDDKNVFPSLSVKVQNVRIYNNARIDRVLYYASSVFAYAGGPLQDVFEDVTKDLGTSSNVKIFETEDDFLATQVDGVNIIFGGCEKLRSRGFVIEDEAAEDDVDLSDELSIMYMFRENKLVAKMYIKYEMDPDIDSILKQFSGNGLYACVRTFDPNINEDMVSKKLSMKKMPLKIVRYANLDEVTTYEAKVDSGLVTCGQQKSLLQVIAYCGKVLRTKKTHIALSVLAVLVGAAIVTILELADLLTGMNALLVMLYQLVWLIPTLITSRVFIR